MSDPKLLEDGLMIIANCKKVTGDIWHAHFGAAAIASYFFIMENDLSAEAEQRVISQSRAMIQKHSLAAPDYGHSGNDIDRAESILLESLDNSIDNLHWVGHNVIYAALSLQAIRELHSYGADEMINGIAELINSFKKTIPGRSWIGYSASEVKRFGIEASDDFPEVDRPEQLSSFVLNELASFKIIYRAEAHHDLIGHLLTFSNALNILHDLGHISYFQRGVMPLLKLAKALRASRDIEPDTPLKLNSPVDRKPFVKSSRASYLPTVLKFWEADHHDIDWDYGHQFKFPYSFYNHFHRVKDVNEAGIENFRYIVSS